MRYGRWHPWRDAFRRVFMAEAVGIVAIGRITANDEYWIVP
jgi:hypothetical protein